MLAIEMIRDFRQRKQKSKVLLEINKYFQERAVVFACIVIDCFFTSIWVLSVWATNNYIVVPLAVEGVDRIALNIFQWLSAGSTLLVLLLYIVRDLCIVFAKIYYDTIEKISKNKRDT